MRINTICQIFLVAILLCPLCSAQNQSTMSLDQRNMAYQSGPGPLLDFAQIPGPDGTVIATISMIDGNQVAYFDKNGRMVSGKGRFEYKARVPDGLYMGFAFEFNGQKASGGIYIADLIFEYCFDGNGPNALQYAFVHSLKPASDKFAFAYIDKTTQEVKTGSTKFTDLDCSNGHISLTLGELGDFGTNKRFRVNLPQPMQGKLELADQTPAAK